MTRSQVWALLAEAIPGIYRMTRIDQSAAAVVATERVEPAGLRNLEELSLRIIIPVPSIPAGLEEDARIAALKVALDAKPIEYNYTLEPDDAWGCSLYTVQLKVAVMANAQD